MVAFVFFNLKVLINIQVYKINNDIEDHNYIVDFWHKASYKASTEPGAAKYDMADPTMKDNLFEYGGDDENRSVVVCPFTFLDLACKIIAYLAGCDEPIEDPTIQTVM